MKRSRTQSSQGIPVYDPDRPEEQKALHPRILAEPMFDEIYQRHLLALRALSRRVWVRAVDLLNRPVVYVEDHDGGKRFAVLLRNGRERPVRNRNLRPWPASPVIRRSRSRTGGRRHRR